jgi:hypothetical protein
MAPGSLGNSVLIEVLPGVIGLNQQAQAITLLSTQDGLVAHAGGGQGAALAITSRMARFITVATIADSSLLPPAIAGLLVTVRNDGANSMNVFPQANGDIINALAANTALACAAASTTTFRCYTTGKWVSN